MTREEAIAYFERHIDLYCVTGICREAEEMAIAALKQQPCPDTFSRSDMLDAVGHGTTYTSEDLQKIIKGLPPVNPQPCDDVISRQYLLDNCVVDKVTMPYVPVSKIENAPPVTSQPKTGHWILTQRERCVDISCSECRNIRFKDYAYGYTIDELNLEEVNDLLAKIRMNYCECCGAKMMEILTGSESEGSK